MEMTDTQVLMLMINETLSTFVDWLGDVFMQVGLAFIILYGYFRHWVSEICFFSKSSMPFSAMASFKVSFCVCIREEVTIFWVKNSSSIQNLWC